MILISGRLEVQTFIPIGSRVSIIPNIYEDFFEGMDVGYLSSTAYEFADNEASNISQGAVLGGVSAYGPFDNWTLSMSRNVFTGVYGPFFDPATFSGQVTCQLMENSVENDSGVGIYLGPGTNTSLVVCTSPSDAVENLGTNNKLIDCQDPAVGNTKSLITGALARAS